MTFGLASDHACRAGALIQGRFSGRLQHKAGEAGLVEECRVLGPLLGGSVDPDNAGREAVMSGCSHHATTPPDSHGAGLCC